MDLQASLVETAHELFRALERIDPAWKVRTRYGALREVLTVAVDQQLRDVTVKLGGMYAKIDFLLKKHQVRENDPSLSRALSDLRHRLRDVSVLPDAQLESTWLTDLKAVTRFVELLYAERAPERLAARLPLAPSVPSVASAKERGRMPDFFRCIVNAWDERYIYATREDTDDDVRIDFVNPVPYVEGDWTYVVQLLRKGMALNVVRPRTNEGGDAVLPELLILDPDFLVNVTSIATCFDACGTSPLLDLVHRLAPFAQTKHTLLGNFAGQLLDEVAYGKNHSYAESIREFFRTNALNFASCPDFANGMSAKDFHDEAKRQKAHIGHLLFHDYAARTATGEAFDPNRLILEPSFISVMLGLQGRMDFLDLSMRSVIEQKSGKCQWAPGAPATMFTGRQEPHFVQLLLYRALLHYQYGVPYEHIHSFLLYSRYADGLDYVTSAPKKLFEAIKVRNMLAWSETYYAEGGLRLLETLKPERIFPHASGKLWENYKKPELRALLSPIHDASSLERSYYLRFLRFVANEQALSKIGNRTKENSGFASTWNATLDDKRAAGNIYENLTLQAEATDGNVPDATLFFDRSGETAVDADLSNFRRGDIVFFYPYQRGTIPDATRVMVFRATITDIRADALCVRLRNAQTSERVFAFFNRKGYVWAVEHDFMDSSYSSLYRALHAFLSAPKARRDLLLGQRRPEVDTSRTLLGNYGNEEFNSIVLHARRAKDIYLLIGPPGTGKTSYGMRNILLEELRHEGTQVLLLSYTNRAVDEICSKLEEEGLDYLRLGSDFSCDERYRQHLLCERMKTAARLDTFVDALKSVRLVCGTTTSLNSAQAIFGFKHFSLAIVDEASQILEPHIIGLLAAHTDGQPAIDRFVLIGDEKQLPAVVQQGTDESAVSEPELQAVGLTDCRLSLFERMLHLYGYDADGNPIPDVCHLLTHQGRMHHDIADFPSEHFYGGKLTEVPLAHQTEATPAVSAEKEMAVRLLDTQRVSFLSCRPSSNPDEPDKVNTVEARLIARLAKHVYDLSPQTFDPSFTLGIIVPYRNQISTVRLELQRYGIDALQRVTIDTVERYQGSQRDVIVYSFTAKKKYQLSFLTSNEYVDGRTGQIIDRKLNVAMTRARKRLVLVGNAPLLSADVTFSRLIDYCKARGAYLSIDTTKESDKNN